MLLTWTVDGGCVLPSREYRVPSGSRTVVCRSSPSVSADCIPASHPQKIPENYVGFVNLPNQVYRKSVKRGFEFTLMVVGE